MKVDNVNSTLLDSLGVVTHDVLFVSVHRDGSGCTRRDLGDGGDRNAGVCRRRLHSERGDFSYLLCTGPGNSFIEVARETAESVHPRRRIPTSDDPQRGSRQQQRPNLNLVS